MATRISRGQRTAMETALDKVKKRSDEKMVGIARAVETIENKHKDWKIDLPARKPK